MYNHSHIITHTNCKYIAVLNYGKLTVLKNHNFVIIYLMNRK